MCFYCIIFKYFTIIRNTSYFLACILSYNKQFVELRSVWASGSSPYRSSPLNLGCSTDKSINSFICSCRPIEHPRIESRSDLIIFVSTIHLVLYQPSLLFYICICIPHRSLRAGRLV